MMFGKTTEGCGDAGPLLVQTSPNRSLLLLQICSASLAQCTQESNTIQSCKRYPVSKVVWRLPQFWYNLMSIIKLHECRLNIFSSFIFTYASKNQERGQNSEFWKTTALSNTTWPWSKQTWLQSFISTLSIIRVGVRGWPSCPTISFIPTVLKSMFWLQSPAYLRSVAAAAAACP